MADQKKFKRKLRYRFVVDPRFQMKYGLWLMGIGLVCFCIMGFLAYISVYQAVETKLPSEISIQVLSEIVKPSAMFLQHEIIISLAILSIFLFFIGVIGTHKISGPLFNIKRHLTSIQRGSEMKPIRIRHGDELHDLAYTLNRLIFFIYLKDKKLKQAINFLETDLESSNPDIIEKLGTLKKEINKTFDEDSGEYRTWSG